MPQRIVTSHKRFPNADMCIDLEYSVFKILVSITCVIISAATVAGIANTNLSVDLK
jgi:hypothetical protein